MKYNLRNLTKLIIVLLLLSLCMSLFSCGNDAEGSSSQEESSETSLLLELTRSDVIALLSRDKLLTEIFVCNSLCDDSLTSAARQLLPEDNEYSDFSVLDALLDSTYAKESGDKSFFMAYPMNQVPSVMNVKGRTSVFRHSGSNFDDFVNLDSVEISDTDDETVKLITAITETGNEIEIKVLLENGVWLLEKGIYRANPPKETEFFGRTETSNLGSLSRLRGNILVIELFISDEEYQITSKDEENFHKIISPALDRLAIQATDHGEETKFVYKRAYFDHENVLGTKVIDFDVMFAETGFGTLKSFAEANYDVDSYDGYFFAVCMNKSIKTSFACYDGNEDTENYYGERVLISPKTTSREIYLSVLKMLGAYGYNEGKMDEYTESLFSFYFPTDSVLCDDIMLSEMSPVTAYACGVTDKLDSFYRIFIPNN